jgi:hypothetical protein
MRVRFLSPRGLLRTAIILKPATLLHCAIFLRGKLRKPSSARSAGKTLT